MVTKREIKIRVTKTGEIEIDVLNAQGQECLEWTKDIEEALGGVVRRELKDQFYANNEESLQQGH